jgi:dTDP-4-amino-4,6-dideoxygalactose transaminase
MDMPESRNVTVPFFRPHIGEDEINEVIAVLKSGWLTTGKRSAAFEADFADFLGGGVEAVAVNSATSGLHLALEAVGIGPGDEVIIPDYTFTATGEVVRYLGADPVFVDVDPATLNVRPEAIERAVTERTKAVMPVHFAGLPCDMTAINAIARRHGLRVIEDAAHAFPATHGNRLIGQQDSDATVFSFYANKTITTGEGGMLVTRDAALAKRARVMRLHGFDRDAFDRFSSGKWAYDVVAPGYKYNMTDMAAALGLHQLKKASWFREERAKVARQYLDRLAGLPLDLPIDAAAGDMHSWHIFIVRVRDDALVNRDRLFELLGKAGITCSVHYTPLHRFRYWRETYGLSAEQFPGAERAGSSAITLPLYVEMPQEQIDHVVETLHDILRG